jgi:molecular chaperone GrpE
MREAFSILSRNFVNRIQKDKDDFLRLSMAGVFRELLLVADNIDNALGQMNASTDLNTLKSGVEMTYKSFFDVLRKMGVAPFNSAGERFDPRLHEAVRTMHSDDISAGSVITEVRRGYLINGRLLRAALVVVSTGPDRPTAEQCAESALFKRENASWVQDLGNDS